MRACFPPKSHTFKRQKFVCLSTIKFHFWTGHVASSVSVCTLTSMAMVCVLKIRTVHLTSFGYSLVPRMKSLAAQDYCDYMYAWCNNARVHHHGDPSLPPLPPPSFPREWIKGDGYPEGIGRNEELSERDKEHVKRLYGPPRVQVAIETNPKTTPTTEPTTTTRTGTVMSLQALHCMTHNIVYFWD